jgi:hypothetical protein
LDRVAWLCAGKPLANNQRRLPWRPTWFRKSLKQ